MLAGEYLARIGYDHLVGARHVADDEDDVRSIARARRLDDARVIGRLLADEPHPLVDHTGARWINGITWPDRLPGLVTWSGRQTLAKLIRDRQDAIRWVGEPHKKGSRLRDLADIDPMTLDVPMRGASGIDARACPNALDVGFSLDVQDIATSQRPALELLAIVGMETVPSVSFGARVCGVVAGGSLWRFAVEARTGGYYYRWGEMHEHEWGPVARRWRALSDMEGGR